MKSYTIIGYDYKRNDGLVEVRIRPKVGGQEMKDNSHAYKRKE